MDIYSHLCLTDVSVKTALIQSGPRPFKLHCSKPWGDIPNDPDTGSLANIVIDILIDTRHNRHADIMQVARAWIFSARVTKCGVLIGSGTPRSSIKVDTRGGICITCHRCRSTRSAGIPLTVSRCLIMQIITTSDLFSKEMDL